MSHTAIQVDHALVAGGTVADRSPRPAVGHGRLRPRRRRRLHHRRPREARHRTPRRDRTRHGRPGAHHRDRPVEHPHRALLAGLHLGDRSDHHRTTPDRPAATPPTSASTRPDTRQSSSSPTSPTTPTTSVSSSSPTAARSRPARRPVSPHGPANLDTSGRLSGATTNQSRPTRRGLASSPGPTGFHDVRYSSGPAPPGGRGLDAQRGRRHAPGRSRRRPVLVHAADQQQRRLTDGWTACGTAR